MNFIKKIFKYFFSKYTVYHYHGGYVLCVGKFMKKAIESDGSYAWMKFDDVWDRTCKVPTVAEALEIIKKREAYFLAMKVIKKKQKEEHKRMKKGIVWEVYD